MSSDPCVAVAIARASRCRISEASRAAGARACCREDDARRTACARLGWRSRYVACFGDDENGRQGQSSLADEGVDISACRVAPGTRNEMSVAALKRRGLGARETSPTPEEVDVLVRNGRS